MNRTYVTASELADYIYCECCWADKIDGLREQTEEMVRGAEAHDRLQWMYASLQFLRQVALIIVIGGLILLGIFALILYVTGNL